MVDSTIILITPSQRYQDDDGVWRTRKQSKREILARVSSVDRREFFAGGEAGFRPEYQFTVFAAEYHEEALCEYEGKTYAVYRTYHVPGTDYLEIYVQRKVGITDGEKENSG